MELFGLLANIGGSLYFMLVMCGWLFQPMSEFMFTMDTICQRFLIKTNNPNEIIENHHDASLTEIPTSLKGSKLGNKAHTHY